MIDVVDEVLQLAGGFAKECPHLLRVLVINVRIREVIRQFFPNRFEALPQLAKTLPNVLQVDC